MKNQAKATRAIVQSTIHSRRLLLVINGEAFRREQVYLMTKSPGSVTLLKVEERTKDLFLLPARPRFLVERRRIAVS